MFEGILLGILTFVSMLLTYMKIPQFLQSGLKRFKLFTDIGSMVLVYFLLGSISKSIVAIVGAIVAGLLVGISLEIFSKKVRK